VDPRADLDDVEDRKFLSLQGFELRLFGSPAHSQPLYRLRYPGSLMLLLMMIIIIIINVFLSAWKEQTRQLRQALIQREV
jgi:hypothetical protein